MDLWTPSLVWIYALLFTMSTSRSSAYFGLTGKAQIRDVKDIDQEATYMTADEQDSVYLWNENGYYTAPSNSYERIDLSAQPDSENQSRGVRSKKNAGLRKPGMETVQMPQADAAMADKSEFTFDIQTHPRYPGMRRIAYPTSYQRREAGLRPEYHARLSRVPRYPRTGPFRVQQMHYPQSAYQHGKDGVGVPPRYRTSSTNGRSYPFDGHTPHQAVSRPVQSVNIDTLVTNRDQYPRNQNYGYPHATNRGGAVHHEDVDVLTSHRRNGDTKRGTSSPLHTARTPQAGVSSDAKNTNIEVNGDSSVGPGEVKPLFVTKDIPAIMTFMGVDENGEPYVKVNQDIDPSSLSATHRSDAGSRATDLPPLIPSSEINKKDARKNCDDMKLTRKQRKLCKRDPGLPQVLREATATSVAECQYQFRFERWNCSTGNTRIHLLSKGNRETAFLFAISSAGLTHTIARACAEGFLEKCSCDETYSDHANQEAWMWGGCGDNVQAAAKFVRRFLRPKSRSRDLRAEVDKHNSDLGIRMVRQSVEKTCKCHGVSGSCTTKTCWRKVAPFYEIGEKIKSAYNRSVKVASVNSADGRPKLVRLRRTRRNRPEIKPGPTSLENETMEWITPPTLHYEADVLDGDFTGHLSNVSTKFGRPGLLRVEHRRIDAMPRNNELVYLENSPQYCKRTRYSLGTKGRLCVKEKNCDKMCCGRGYTTQIRIVRRSCQCEVRWCCYVQCKTCVERREIHTCK